MIELAILSHYLLLISLGLTFVGVAYCLYQIFYAQKPSALFVEYANTFITLAYVFVSCVLLYAFINFEFAYKYVHDYSDRGLPIFYRITAFWGGQAGSLLFWALSVVICGYIFQNTNAYKNLSVETRCWYILFYFVGLAFFGLMLTTYNDPFALLNPVPSDGRGLNPLLQHPGMIFHPPLLLLGYGGFTIPACLALAQAMSKGTGTSIIREIPWFKCTMVLTLTAWLLLSAGIILGAWWAYMELGWGGYWAWDPVENASLIPWFFATAAIHLGFLDAYRHKASRFHTVTMGLTYISAIFATWLVRGNVVDSVHAFGAGGVGSTIGYYMLFATIVVFAVLLMMPKTGKSLEGPETREGLAFFTVLLLLAISVIIMLATLWPVITSMVARLIGAEQTASVGLGVDFYNSVILPLLTVIIALLTACPWVSWSGQIKNKLYFFIVIAAFVVTMGVCWTVFDIDIPMTLIGASISVTCMFSWLLFIVDQKYNKLSPAFVHIGFAMMALGVAISGTYQLEQDVAMKKGESIYIDGFEVKLNEFYVVPVYKDAIFVVRQGEQAERIRLNYNSKYQFGDYTIAIADIIDNSKGDRGRDADIIVQKGQAPAEVVHFREHSPQPFGEVTLELVQRNLNHYSFIEAELFVFKDGEDEGILSPQRRRYATHPGMLYSEAVTIPSLGKEIYATFSGIDDQDRGRLRILIQPMVNWIWIGGVIMSLAPFLSVFGLSNRRGRREDSE